MRGDVRGAIGRGRITAGLRGNYDEVAVYVVFFWRRSWLDLCVLVEEVTAGSGDLKSLCDWCLLDIRTSECIDKSRNSANPLLLPRGYIVTS
jgi:hypothetical protein